MDRFDVLLDRVPVGIVVHDAEFRFSRINQAACEYLGRRPEELLGRDLAEHLKGRYAPEHAEELLARFREVLRTGRTFSSREWPEGLRERAGRSFLLDFTLDRFTDPLTGKVLGVLVVLRDTAEFRAVRKTLETAERQLDEEKALLEQIIEQFPAGVLIARGPGGERMLGNALVEKYFRDVYGRSSGGEYRTARIFRMDGTPYALEDWPVQRALRSGETIQGEDLYLTSPEGVTRYYRVLAAPVRGHDDQIVAAAAVVRDITEEIREEKHEKLLADSGKVLSASLDLSAIFQALSDLVVPELADWCNFAFLKPDGTFENIEVVHPDPAKKELTRRAAERSKVVPNDPRAAVAARRSSLLLSDIPPEMHEATTADEKHREVIQELAIRSAIIVPLVSRDECLGTLGFFSSRPGRRYDEKDLAFVEELARRVSFAVDNARLYSQAQEAIRVRDEFLSVASHELKTPLTSFKLQLLLARQVATGEPRGATGSHALTEKLEVLESQAERLCTLVEDLLDMSRIRSGRFTLEKERVNLAEVVRTVLQRQGSLLESARCPLELSLDSAVAGDWDLSRLDQVVVNLLSNALKYGAGRPIDIRLGKADGRAVLEIRDHGIGIHPDDLERIFHRYERAVSGESYGGMGLGLYIARQIVEAHGGLLRVDSEVGQGARFIVELPLAQSS